ncbi:hypothetical protein FPQ37_40325 (plasmid) [Burkholderia contaminans]|nr:hypothetical protein FPQ37_40325 [Burkholderia contaminans]
MQLPKTAKNRNLETVRIRVLPPVLLAPLRRPSPAPLRRPATPTSHLPRSDWPNFGLTDVDPREYWFWVLRLVGAFGEDTEG